MSRYQDFDSFCSEVDEEPVRFKAGGLDFELAPQLPVRAALKALAIWERHGRDPEAQASEAEIVELAETLMGKENAERLMDSNITIEKFGEIVLWLFAQYSGKPKPDEAKEAEPGNPPSPAAAGEA